LRLVRHQRSVDTGVVEVSGVKVVQAIGYVVEQLLTGSEDQRVARRRAQRRRASRRELVAHRRQRTTDASVA